MKSYYLIFTFILNFITSRSVASDVNLETYKSSSSSINSIDLNWSQEPNDNVEEEETLYKISLGYSTGQYDATDLNNASVSLTSKEISTSIGVATPSEETYSLGYTNSIEKTVDVMSNSIFLQYSKKFDFENGLFSKIKLKARLDSGYIQHDPISPVNFDTSMLKSSIKFGNNFYFSNQSSFSLAFKKYFYTKDINRFVADLRTINSNNLTSIFANEVAGYGDFTLSGGFGFVLSDFISIDLNYDRTTPAYAKGTVGQDFSGSLIFDFSNDFSLTAEAGTTNYVSNIKTATTSSSYYQLSGNYSF